MSRLGFTPSMCRPYVTPPYVENQYPIHTYDIFLARGPLLVSRAISLLSGSVSYLPPPLVLPPPSPPLLLLFSCWRARGRGKYGMGRRQRRTVYEQQVGRRNAHAVVTAPTLPPTTAMLEASRGGGRMTDGPLDKELGRLPFVA